MSPEMMPNEILARSQADKILDGSLDNVLRDVPDYIAGTVGELLTDAYARGFEDGTTVSGFEGEPDDSATLFYAYLRGVNDTQRQMRENNG